MHCGKKLKKLFLMIVAGAFASFSMAVWAGEKAGLEQDVAMVNGTAITQGELDREMMRVKQQLASRGRPLNEAQLPEIEKRVLDSLIDRELLYQESQDKHVEVSDKAVDGRLNMLKKRFPSEAEFEKALQGMGISEKGLRSEMEKRLAIQKFMDTQIAQNITVPQDEVKAFYEAHPDLFKEPEKVKARHILVKVEPGADASAKSRARDKLEEVQEKLQKGEDFSALAKAYSEGPSSEKGGDLGYFSKGQMVKPFEEAAFATPPGQVSEIVKTRFGYHLIEVVDKKPEAQISFKEIKGKLERYLKRKKTQQEIDTHLKKLRKKAKVETFLKDNS